MMNIEGNTAHDGACEARHDVHGKGGNTVTVVTEARHVQA